MELINHLSLEQKLDWNKTWITSSLCDYSDVYIILNGTITIASNAAEDADANNTNKKVIFKNYAPFKICITEIKIAQVDIAQDIDAVMPIVWFSRI